MTQQSFHDVREQIAELGSVAATAVEASEQSAFGSGRDFVAASASCVPRHYVGACVGNEQQEQKQACVSPEASRMEKGVAKHHDDQQGHWLKY